MTFQTKFKTFSLFLIFFFLSTTSCQKQTSDLEEISEENVENTIVFPPSNGVSFRSGEDMLLPLFDLFLRHFRHYQGTDPAVYFREDFYSEFNTKLAVENEKLEQMGFVQYVNDLESKSLLSNDSKNLMLFIYQKSELTEDIIISDLKNKLILEYAPNQLLNYEPDKDPFYLYVYSILFEIVNNYYGINSGDSLETRGDCPFKDFIAHVIASASAGVGIGTTVGAISGEIFDDFGELELLGLGGEILAGIVGGVIGGIVGLVTYDDGDNCWDCRQVSFVSVESNDDCGLTRTLIALGAGPDALGFEWRITQGGTTATITTAENTLEITQLNPNEPIGVSVATLCLEDGETDIADAELTNFTITEPEDLSINGILGEVGELTIEATCAWGEVDDILDGEAPPVTSCFHIDYESNFEWQTSNHGSGLIEYEFSFTPSTIANIQEGGSELGTTVEWNDTGEVTLEVTATNICTGLSETNSITFTIQD